MATANILYLNEICLLAISVEMLEDLLEIHHSALAQYQTVLDVKKLDSRWILINPLDRVLTSHHCPIDIQLDGYLIRIRLCDEDFLYLAAITRMTICVDIASSCCHPSKLTVVIVVAPLHAIRLADLASHIVNFGHRLSILQTIDAWQARLHDVRHLEDSMVLAGFLPEIANLA